MKKHLFSYLWFLILLLGACQTDVPQEHLETVQAPLTTMMLVRHAEKVEDGSKNPSLTEKGARRAETIRQLFEEAGINALYATPFERTEKTLQPLAATLGMTVENYDPSLGAEQLIDEMLAKHAGEKIFIAGHSNTIPAMLNVLTGSDDYEDFTHDQYDDLFVVSLAEKGKAAVTRLQVKIAD